MEQRPRTPYKRPPVIAVAAALLGAGCASYAPRPLDPVAHRAAWHARGLDAGAIAARLAELASPLAETGTVVDASDGLTLAEGRLVALVLHPDLRLARLRLARAAAHAEHAGRWPDPTLSFDVLRITESVPDPWVVAPGLGFTLPLSGRLAAERRRAGAARTVAELEVREAEWDALHGLEEAWVAWSAARLRVAETEALLAALADLVDTTRRLAEAGELLRTEASLVALEEARRRNELVRLRGDVAAAEQALRARLGLAPDARVALVPSLAAGSPPEDATYAALAARNPTLARLGAQYEEAEAKLRREVRAQYPDLTLGPLFESDEGQSRVGLAGALPLPFLDRNRRAIAEARVDRELARAASETGYERLAGRLAAVAARATALAEQGADLERVLVPLVDRQLADAIDLVRLGEGSGLLLLESLSRAHETKLELVATRAAAAHARAELAWLTGPAPVEPAPVAEDTP